MIFHPLHTHIQPPEEMNNPFDYKPHPLCLVAAEEVQASIARHTEWQDELHSGKMFGVLIVENPDDGAIGYLAAYSGQLLGRSDWEGFVPAVYDYLQPDGHFKQEEHRIDLLNEEIRRKEAEYENSEELRQLNNLRHDAAQAIERKRLEMTAARHLRELRRKECHLSEREQQELIRESQFLKAELHRTKKRFADEIERFEQKTQLLKQHIESLRQQRRQRSDALQRWLFSQFVMVNCKGEKKTLTDIFLTTALRTPPAGAGECCEPKLLQYAYTHSLRPRAMAMFWWGESPRQEVRHHLSYYPACSGKCKPILQWQLQMEHFRWGSGTVKTQQPTLTVVYEDDHLLAIDKPSGMLSVPGIDSPLSAITAAKHQFPQLSELTAVHRLDMDTSGLLLLAKTRQAQRHLQQQFASHTIEKTYVALLEQPWNQDTPTIGTINLSLIADILDRPRQKADNEHGKPAITHYQLIGTTSGHPRLLLRPVTGRTHQLRVHCSHALALANPILGDRLYGTAADTAPLEPRLYLHAQTITFTHPATGEVITLESKAPF